MPVDPCSSAPQINPSNGNMLVQISPPSSGAVAPVVTLYYNSLFLKSSEFGTGWTLSPKQTVTKKTANRVVLTLAARLRLWPAGPDDRLLPEPRRHDRLAAAQRRWQLDANAT